MLVNRKSLKAALTAAKRTAPPYRYGAPVLQCVRLDAGAGSIRLEATDLEATYRATVPAEGSGSWAAIVPFKVLAEAVKSGPDMLEIHAAASLGGGFDHVKVGAGSIRVGAPVEDWPMIPDAHPHVATIPSAALADLVRIVGPAASDDGARPVLTGIYLEGSTAGSIGATATDSYRLHHHEAAGSLRDFKAIVPARVLRAVAAAIGRKGTGAVVIRLDEGRITFDLQDGTTIGSRVIEGEFPNYRQLVPSDAGDGRIENGPAFRAAVKAAGAYAVDTRPVTVSVDAAGVDVSASSPEAGDYSERLEASGSSIDVTAGFNAEYLGDALEAIGDGTLYLRSGLKPCMALPAGSHPYGTWATWALVMPVRLPAVEAAERAS